jgi:hypothetical protein
MGGGGLGLRLLINLSSPKISFSVLAEGRWRRGVGVQFYCKCNSEVFTVLM